MRGLKPWRRLLEKRAGSCLPGLETVKFLWLSFHSKISNREVAAYDCEP